MVSVAAYFELEASDSAREQKPPSWPILDILIRKEAAMLTYSTVDVDKVKAQWKYVWHRMTMYRLGNASGQLQYLHVLTTLTIPSGKLT